MPLYKRKAFDLVERPKELSPNELVFQVRFTKEIFKDYGEYLNRINLYRQRVWTCKVSGKTNLTFEEALVSEKRATEKVQQFPKELVVPVLRDVQFSMLTLKDLANTIAEKLQERMLEGSEVYGRKNNRIYPCKVVKILKEAADKTQYEVAWLDKDKKITSNAVVVGEDLIKKKLPFNRDVLRSFIKESTYRSVPWVLHDNLARKHGISTDPPEELRSQICIHDGLVMFDKKRKKNEEDGVENNGEVGKKKRKKLGNADKEDDKPSKAPIKYPIDDLLVHPAADDPVFTQHPPLCRDFNVPMDCVGDLIMVWDFFSSFGRQLHLSPFSLEDFGNAICYKDSNVILIVESHSALLRFLIKDDGEYYTAINEKKRKPKITIVTWREFLCDFLEMIDVAELSSSITTIKRGHYGLLDIRAKLGIFRELVTQVLETDLFREKLDQCIEERHALASKRREEALEEGRKKRENKEQLKDSDGKEVKNEEHDVKALEEGRKKRGNNEQLKDSDGKEVKNEEHDVKPFGSNSSEPVDHNHNRQNGDVAEKQDGDLSCRQKNGSNQRNGSLNKNAKKQKVDANVPGESKEGSSKKGAQKLMQDDSKPSMGKKSKEQKNEYIEREMEKCFIRTNPLGKDKYHSRYWFFRREARIYVESSDSAQWGYYTTKDELDSLMGSLNKKGERERTLKKQLEKGYDKICAKLQKRSKEVAQQIAMDEAALRRSTRVRAPPRENPALAFLKYHNKW